MAERWVTRGRGAPCRQLAAPRRRQHFFHGQVATPPVAPLVLRLFQRRSDMNRGERIANQDRLRALVADHGAEVTPFCAHDPVELARLQLAAPR